MNWPNPKWNKAKHTKLLRALVLLQSRGFNVENRIRDMESYERKENVHYRTI